MPGNIRDTLMIQHTHWWHTWYLIVTYATDHPETFRIGYHLAALTLSCSLLIACKAWYYANSWTGGSWTWILTSYLHLVIVLNDSYPLIIIIIIIIRAARVIPIVMSSRGITPKSLSQSLTRLNLHPNKYIQLQKSVILGTCSIVRNFLNYK